MPKTGRIAVVISLLSLVSAALGFLRESLIAYRFGAGEVTDAYYIALIVPDLIASWISYTLTNALIPMLRRIREYNPGREVAVASRFFFLVFLITGVLAIVGYLSRDRIIDVLAPGLSAPTRAVATHMLAVMIFAVSLSGMSGVLSGIHNALDSFTFPGLIGAVYNITMLFMLVITWRHGAMALAGSYMVAMGAKVGLQLIPLVARGRLRPTLKLWTPEFIPVLRLAFPIFLSVGVGSVNLIVDRFLASSLQSGSISDLNYANKVAMLPVGVVGLSIATALYTKYVSLVAHGDSEGLRREFGFGLSWSLIASFLAVGLFTMFPSEVIRIIYTRGAFTSEDAVYTSQLLLDYGLFIPFYILNPVVTHYFYAQSKNWYVIRSSSVAVAVNIIGSLILVHRLGAEGLVIANGFSQIVYVVNQLRVISADVGLKWWEVFRDIRISLLAIAVAYTVARLLTKGLDMGPVGSLLVLGGVGAGTLIAVARYASHDILSMALNNLLRRIGKCLGRGRRLSF